MKKASRGFIQKSVKFVVADTLEETDKEKFAVGTKHGARIEEIDNKNYCVTCTFSEPDLDELKQVIDQDQLKEYVQIEKSSDLFGLSDEKKECEEIESKVNRLAEFCIENLRIRESNYLDKKENEVKKDLLSKMIGDYFFHQSDSSPDQLKLSWKLFNDQVITEDVEYKSLEEQKKYILIVDELEFDTEEELVVQYISKYIRLVEDVYRFKKYQESNTKEQINENLKKGSLFT